MNMSQMQMMMERMHQQNYINNTNLAQHFREISDIYSSMAQAEYQMYQMHAAEPKGMQMQSPMYPMPGMGR